MTRVHTRHARLTHREMHLAPAEPVEIVGTGTKWLPLMAMVLCFVLTVIGFA